MLTKECEFINFNPSYLDPSCMSDKVCNCLCATINNGRHKQIDRDYHVGDWGNLVIRANESLSINISIDGDLVGLFNESTNQVI